MHANAIPDLPGKSRPYVLAHRGNKTLCPENTMASFRRALQDGADIIETDLHISRDGEFVCIHDDTVDRTTNGSGVVDDMSTAELKALVANNGFESFAAERVPLLTELIEIVPEDVALALELKSDRFLEAEVCGKLAALLQEGNILDRTIILSFSMARIQAVLAEEPRLHIGLITLSNAIPIRNVHMMGPFWPLLLINPFYIKIAHSRNQAVCPLDPAPDSRLWFYKRLGCDAVLTDNPYETCKRLKQLRE